MKSRRRASKDLYDLRISNSGKSARGIKGPPQSYRAEENYLGSGAAVLASAAECRVVPASRRIAARRGTAAVGQFLIPALSKGHFYSINSSASANHDGGMVRPSELTCVGWPQWNIRPIVLACRQVNPMLRPKQ
jgi:hypothetical protein